MLRTLIFVIFAALVPKILAICSQPGSIAIGEVISNASGTPVSSFILKIEKRSSFCLQGRFLCCVAQHCDDLEFGLQSS